MKSTKNKFVEKNKEDCAMSNDEYKKAVIKNDEVKKRAGLQPNRAASDVPKPGEGKTSKTNKRN